MLGDFYLCSFSWNHYSSINFCINYNPNCQWSAYMYSWNYTYNKTKQIYVKFPVLFYRWTLSYLTTTEPFYRAASSLGSGEPAQKKSKKVKNLPSLFRQLHDYALTICNLAPGSFSISNTKSICIIWQQNCMIRLG